MFKEKLTVEDKVEFIKQHSHYKSGCVIQIEEDCVSVKHGETYTTGYKVYFQDFACIFISFPLNSNKFSVVQKYGEWMATKLTEKEGAKAGQEFKKAFNKHWNDERQKRISEETQKINRLFKDLYFIKEDEEKVAE